MRLFSFLLATLLIMPVSHAKPRHLQRLMQTCECTGCDLSNQNFEGFKPAENTTLKNKMCDLSDSTFINANLRDANLSVNLIRHRTASKKVGYESVLQQSLIKGTVFDNANLENAGLAGVNAKHASFQNANLSGADLTRGSFHRAKFQNANMRKAHADADAMNGLQADMRHANFFQANLADAHLSAVFQHANFSCANLTNAVLITSTEFPADKKPWEGVNFSYADLTGANIGATSTAKTKKPQISADVLKQAVFCHTIMPDGSLNDRDC